MKIYVAYRTDGDAVEKMALGSFNKLKAVMKGTHNMTGKKLKKPVDMIGAEFTVVLYDFKPNLDNICQAVTDPQELPALESYEYRVNEHGQLRQVKA
jgi:hypothetical protein